MAWWQHLPEMVDPIAVTIGFFSLYWYAVFFLFAMSVVFLSASFFVWRNEAPYGREVIFDVLPLLFLGALIGGHIGYIVFYNLDFFLQSPLSAILPYDLERSEWTGISGMSFFGGLTGVGVALYFFVRKRGISFWKMADFIVLLAPFALFFGRLGNFFNLELPGRVTTVPWGMFFPGVDPSDTLRHPVVLYEAFGEGVFLFVLLLFFRKKMAFAGGLTCVFLLGYAFIRFTLECFREPDPQIGFLFVQGLSGYTLGQVFSFVLFLGALGSFYFLRRKNYARIAGKQ